MDGYSEKSHQDAIKRRLQTAEYGHRPLHLGGSETIVSLLAQTSSLYRDKVAVTSGGATLTYQELDSRSSVLGTLLLRRLRGRRRPVVIFIEDQARFISSMLAVLKAGAFYIPLDPSFPESRNSDILRQTGAEIILAERVNRPPFGAHGTSFHEVIYVDELEGKANLPSITSSPDDLACITFTSGSTGRPKGVVHSHRNLLQVVRRYTNSLYLGCHDRVSLLTSCSVIASVGTALSSLLNGATLSAFPVLKGGLGELADWLDHQGITQYRSVPSVFRHLMKSVARGRVFSSVRLVRLGGDSLYKSDWELFSQHCGKQTVLVHSYGCSEMSSVSQFYMDSRSQPDEGVLPVGYPLDEVEICLTGSDGVERTVELGKDADGIPQWGEITLRSQYLSSGYWTGPDDRDSVDVLAAVHSGRRVYKTGDLGTIRTGSGLIHLGRHDSQVKISGFRVEMAEIESCLCRYPGVSGAAVVVYVPEHGERQLIGFVESGSEETVFGDEIRAYVGRRFPQYMVPVEILTLPKLPCTPNGKVDRAALLRIRERSFNGRARQPPRTPEEHYIAKVWIRVLKCGEIGIDDNFFSVGGSSLLALRIVNELRVEGRGNVSLGIILSHPTIRELAKLLEENSSIRAATPDTRISRRLVSDRVPLTYVQEGFLRAYGRETRRFIRATWRVMRIFGKFEVNALRSSLVEFVRRHECLRSRIGVVDGTPYMEISHACEYGFSLMDLTGVDGGEIESKAARAVETFLHESIDMAVNPPLSAMIVKLCDDMHLFALAVDHLVSDRASLRIAFDEVWTMYVQSARGVPFALPEIHAQFSDFAVWLQKTRRTWIDRHSSYWTQKLAGAERLTWFVSDEREKKEAIRFELIPIQLGDELTERLRAFSEAQNASLGMAVLTVYVSLLLRWFDRRDVVLPFTTTGRAHPEVENAVGFFASLLWLRIAVSEGDSFLDLLRRVTDEYGSSYEHLDFGMIGLWRPRPACLANAGLNWTPRELRRDVVAHLVESDVRRLGEAIRVIPFEFSFPASGELQVDLEFQPEGGLTLAETEHGIRGYTWCRTGREAGTLRSFAGNFAAFAKAMVDSPSSRVADAAVVREGGGSELISSGSVSHSLMPERTDTQSLSKRTRFISS